LKDRDKITAAEQKLFGKIKSHALIMKEALTKQAPHYNEIIFHSSHKIPQQVSAILTQS
jgi:hypothetical protein